MDDETKHVIKTARHSVIDLYVAGTNGRFFWPYRLQPESEASPSVRRQSFKYILDSGFTNGGCVSNRDLIDAVDKYNPSFVIPNDKIRTGDITAWDAIRTTATRVEDFLNRVEERDGISCTTLIPLQPPYDLHYEHLKVNHPRQARNRHFALGGMKNMQPAQQLRHIRTFRETVNWDVYAHGLGLGASRKMIEALRHEPSLLDSADVSTPQQHARMGKIAGASRKPVYYGPAKGTDLTTSTGKATVAELVDIARMLSPSITDDEDLSINWNQLPHNPPQDHNLLKNHSPANPNPVEDNI